VTRGYKLFRKRKDGTYGPLFINRRQRLVLGELYPAEEHPTKGFAFRPHWHVCSRPVAPHLRTGGNRVWCEVEFTHHETVVRPASQGGIWYLGSTLRILRELDTDEN
jgi:hypothetical protein